MSRADNKKIKYDEAIVKLLTGDVDGARACLDLAKRELASEQTGQRFTDVPTSFKVLELSSLIDASLNEQTRVKDIHKVIYNLSQKNFVEAEKLFKSVPLSDKQLFPDNFEKSLGNKLDWQPSLEYGFNDPNENQFDAYHISSPSDSSSSSSSSSTLSSSTSSVAFSGSSFSSSSPFLTYKAPEKKKEKKDADFEIDYDLDFLDNVFKKGKENKKQEKKNKNAMSVQPAVLSLSSAAIPSSSSFSSSSQLPRASSSSSSSVSFSSSSSSLLPSTPLIKPKQPAVKRQSSYGSFAQSPVLNSSSSSSSSSSSNSSSGSLIEEKKFPINKTYGEPLTELDSLSPLSPSPSTFSHFRSGSQSHFRSSSSLLPTTPGLYEDEGLEVTREEEKKNPAEALLETARSFLAIGNHRVAFDRAMDIAIDESYGQNNNALAKKLMFEIANEVKKKNEKNSLPYFEQCSALGNAVASFYLARCYRNGTGGVNKIDMDEAIRFYREAANIGYVPALVELGIHYYKLKHGRDNDEVISLFRTAEGIKEAARAKGSFEYNAYARGLYYLGQCYEFGVGVESNLVTATNYYEHSRDMGNEEAKAEMKDMADRLYETAQTLEGEEQFVLLKESFYKKAAQLNKKYEKKSAEKLPVSPVTVKVGNYEAKGRPEGKTELELREEILKQKERDAERQREEILKQRDEMLKQREEALKIKKEKLRAKKAKEREEELARKAKEQEEELNKKKEELLKRESELKERENKIELAAKQAEIDRLKEELKVAREVKDNTERERREKEERERREKEEKIRKAKEEKERREKDEKERKEKEETDKKIKEIAEKLKVIDEGKSLKKVEKEEDKKGEDENEIETKLKLLPEEKEQILVFKQIKEEFTKIGTREQGIAATAAEKKLLQAKELQEGQERKNLKKTRQQGIEDEIQRQIVYDKKVDLSKASYDELSIKASKEFEKEVTVTLNGEDMDVLTYQIENFKSGGKFTINLEGSKIPEDKRERFMTAAIGNTNVIGINLKDTGMEELYQTEVEHINGRAEGKSMRKDPHHVPADEKKKEQVQAQPKAFAQIQETVKGLKKEEKHEQEKKGEFGKESNKIDLSNREMSEQIITALDKELQENTDIRSLNLSNCRISEGNLERVIKMIETNVWLTEVDHSGVKVVASGNKVREVNHKEGERIKRVLQENIATNVEVEDEEEDTPPSPSPRSFESSVLKNNNLGNSQLS